MSEQRKKSHSVLLRTGGKIISLELFDAAQWPEQSYDDGLYRVRIDDVWHCKTAADEDKYSFLTLPAVGELVATLLTGQAGDALQPAPAPYLPYKARVRVHVVGELMPLSGSVHAPVHMEPDGRWWCWVWIFGRGATRVPCCDVTLVRVM